MKRQHPGMAFWLCSAVVWGQVPRIALTEIKSKSYKLKAGTAEWEDEVRERISAQWVMLRQMTGSVRRRGAHEALEELTKGGHDVARLDAPSR